MARYLAIDYGLARTGLAVSDPNGRIAFPLATLSLAKLGSRKALLDELARIASESGAEALVMGLPLLADGGESLTTRQVRNAADRIRRRLPLPFYWMPEYLSSEEASLDLRQAGRRGKALKDVLDQQAACRILSSFLAQPETRRIAG